MNKKKGYIAGSLFNEAEVRQRKYEGQVLREQTGDMIDWYNPIDAPINDKSKLPTAQDIFHGDTVHVIHSDYIMADITNNDTGVAKELGIAYGLQYARTVIEEIFKDQPEDIKAAIFEALDINGIKKKKLYAVCSDIRVGTANQYEGVFIPYGLNQYVVGGIVSVPSTITTSFDSAVEELIKDLKNE